MNKLIAIAALLLAGCASSSTFHFPASQSPACYRHWNVAGGQASAMDTCANFSQCKVSSIDRAKLARLVRAAEECERATDEPR